MVLAFPETMESAETKVALVLRLAVIALAPVTVSLLTSLLPPDIKATLVFWRIHDVLPGHRAFSFYAPRDPRIDLVALENNVGQFPSLPREQNALWYRLFKRVEKETSVFTAHRQYLLFRDLASISLLLSFMIPCLLYGLGISVDLIGLCFALFFAQYVVCMIAGTNHGVRFVTNVLALHAERRRV